ncbi:unnamed protein product [Thlaspi arvense]|uniref:Uncharacterized protein n=1 Tax=Thlaspi arvense TaxID=13288 RepID=A0AAU9RNR9_THLAR|nr:unnamed protein product [Thlaspi arvense]
MAPNAHVKKAFRAMNALGIEDKQVKPVLKELLSLYDKNWELIAEDNYRALADAIFDAQETQATQERNELEKKAECSGSEPDRGKKARESDEEDEDALDELEPPLKRLRRRGEGGSSSGLNSPDLGSHSLDEPTTIHGGDTAPILLPFHPLSNENDPNAGAPIVPKDERFADMPFSSTHQDSVEIGNSSAAISEMENTNGHVEVGETVNTVDGASTNGVPPTITERSSEHKLVATVAESSALELASSHTGEVKINLSFAPATGGSSRHLPSMEELRRAMEERCLRSYKILDPNFSVGRFMDDICSCYLELATKAENSANQSPENLPFLTKNVDALKKSVATMAFASNGSSDLATKAINSSNLSPENLPFVNETAVTMDFTSEGSNDENGEVGDTMGLVVVPECQISADDWRLISGVSDVTLGRETVEIPWVNEVNSKVPPAFRYMPQSVVYRDAEVKFTLMNISDDQCCSSCCGDCLAPSMSCRCATALSGFAYTVDGILQKDFLEECVSEARDPKKQVVQFCKECPFEKAKTEEVVEPCKGHLKRKVIKECWIGCGCVGRCGNRVVQQGIHNKLQVFYTPDGRGWGVRSLEKLPKGAFVCEFAGEILTITELFQRRSEKQTSPVILDAYWGSEQGSGVNEALCLDGTQYGNISRFINHRCGDANLIEIPVHVENMDLHYYHVAFFTTREIDAMEELTWDYGVEFNDHVFPTLPFHCRCGSDSCRNVMQISSEKTKKSKKKKKA